MPKCRIQFSLVMLLFGLVAGCQTSDLGEQLIKRDLEQRYLFGLTRSEVHQINGRPTLITEVCDDISLRMTSGSCKKVKSCDIYRISWAFPETSLPYKLYWDHVYYDVSSKVIWSERVLIGYEESKRSLGQEPILSFKPIDRGAEGGGGSETSGPN